MTRRRSLSVLLPALAVAAAGAALATCSVNRARYLDDVYACDLRQTDQTQECGTGWVCHPGSQLGTYDFCAPECAPDGGVQYCAPDGALLTACHPSASACGDGLQCLRTSITADEGLCLPVEVCGRDDECRDPLRRQCLSKVLADAYGAGLKPGMVSNMWCLQGNCNELSPCEAGYSCLGGLPLVKKVPAFCAPNCGRNPRADAGVDDLCPRSFVCTSRMLAALPYAFCLPGLFGFPCETDDHCLIGTCQDVGSHVKACTVPCEANSDCDKLYAPGVGETRAVSCVDGQCITAFTLSFPLLCNPADSRCAAGSTCTKMTEFADAGIPGEITVGEAFCTKECPNGAADCVGNGVATSCLRSPVGTSCVPGLGLNAPVLGTIIQCDPTDADACVKGLRCLKPDAADAPAYCTIPCQADTQCDNQPWIPVSWRCRGTTTRMCGP